MEELTETFRRLVETSQTPPAQWVIWLVGQMAEHVADPVTRLELEHSLRDSPERLEEVQSALDAVGAVVADAALAEERSLDALHERIRAAQQAEG